MKQHPGRPPRPHGRRLLGAKTTGTQYLWRYWNAVRAAADFVAVLAGFALSFYTYAWLIRQGAIDQPPPRTLAYLVIAVSLGVISLIVSWYLGSYRERASVLNLWELQVAVKSHVLTAALFFAILFIINGGYSRLVIGGGLMIALVLMLLERRLLAAIRRRQQISGKLGRRVLIYGCGEAGRLLMKKIVQAPHVGRSLIGFVDDHTPAGRFIECRITQTDQTIFCAPVLGRLTDLPTLTEQYDLHELFITATGADTDSLPQILDLAQGCGLQAAYVPQLGDIRVDQLHVEDLSAIPLLRPHVVPSRPVYLALKRLLDVAVATVLMLLTAPLWVLAAGLIRLTDGGSVFFTQERIGWDGRPFRMFKFRTMRRDTDPYAVSPTHDHDPRITRVGRILRTAGLDELPQLINVLQGDMSLVGPRPEMAFIVDEYTPLERQRLSAKPGITGLWQLSADRVDAIHMNLEYDLYYIRHRSLLFDGLILLETFFFTLDVFTTRIVTSVGRLGSRLRGTSDDTTEPQLKHPAASASVAQFQFEAQESADATGTLPDPRPVGRTLGRRAGGKHRRPRRPLTIGTDVPSNTEDT